MQRKKSSFQIIDFLKTKRQLLYWANKQGNCCFLDNNTYAHFPSKYEVLCAVGIIEVFSLECPVPLDNFIATASDWLFGHVGYDCKNYFEKGLLSENFDGIKNVDSLFFQPKIVVELTLNELIIHSFCDQHKEIANEIFSLNVEKAQHNEAISTINTIPVQERLTKGAYIKKLDLILERIARGDVYIVNFCQEFFANDALIQPLEVYQKLSLISPNPFSCFYKQGYQYVMCASPERYLQKKGNRLVSQPIKGTQRRDLSNTHVDGFLKQTLVADPKERAENIMVVDLVRNDLGRVCKDATIVVDELLGLYTFPNVHQLISTISGELKENILFSEIIGATFPMGSMTGTPKYNALRLIEEVEVSKRGLFSGAIGYINPNGDFDFNVVIRSIFYNERDRYLSFQTGGGITHLSDPENEYKECMLKAQPLFKSLEH